jgi:hypothetical protein
MGGDKEHEAWALGWAGRDGAEVRVAATVANLRGLPGKYHPLLKAPGGSEILMLGPQTGYPGRNQVGTVSKWQGLRDCQSLGGSWQLGTLDCFPRGDCCPPRKGPQYPWSNPLYLTLGLPRERNTIGSGGLIYLKLNMGKKR